MKGKTVIVTGATAGIGKETARALAEQGARVVLIGRDEPKLRTVVSELSASSGNSQIEFELADLSSIEAVRRVGAICAKKYPVVDVLVNNVGGIFLTRDTTVDGYERTFATNHLAPFILTQAVLPSLRQATAARIVNVSSLIHWPVSLQFDDLFCERSRYFAFLQYARSKLANVLFTQELARRLQGTRITVNAVHPGTVASNFLAKGRVWRVLYAIGSVFMIGSKSGAGPSVYLASSPDLEGITGQYFSRFKQARPGLGARDAQIATRLWEWTEQLLASHQARKPL